MPDFLSSLEWTCKTVRSVCREVHGAWAEGRELQAGRRDAADALAEKESEEECSEPMPPQSADFDDEPCCSPLGEFCFGYNEYQPLPEAMPVRVCDNCGTNLGEIAAVSQVVKGMFCSNRCVSVAEVRDEIAEMRQAPAASTTAVGSETSAAMQGAEQSGPEEGATPLAPQPSSGALDLLDIGEAARCIELWLQSDDCPDLPEYQLRLKQLHRRLYKASKAEK